MMDPKSASDELPELYRALLDRVAQLDAAGQRSAGLRLRRESTRIYSRAWDERARRGLQELLWLSGDRGTVPREPVRGTQRRGAPVS